MTKEVIQDSISLQLRADKVVISDTVKVSVTINALAIDGSESDLRRDIKATLNRFIETDWQINGIERSKEASGHERISMRGTSRIKETENYNLIDRAEAASRKGLTLSDIYIDATVPVVLLEEAEQAVRMDLLAKAKAELAKIADVLGDGYRIGSLRFANQGDPVFRKGGSVTAMAASTYGSGLSAPSGAGGEETLTNAQKVSMSADVTFYRVVNE